MKRTPLVTLALAGLAGCAGTSPNLSSPQMQSPSLGNGALAARSVAGLPRGASLEASYPVLEPLKTPEGTFVAPPYLQLETPTPTGRTESLAVLWQCPSPTKSDSWSVEVRPARGGDWKKIAGALAATEIKAEEGAAARTALKATLADLEPGELFDYQVLQDGKPMFLARGRARRGARAVQRFVVLGEQAASKKLAYQAALARPDFACALDADLGAFAPYNVDAAGADSGAPLLRSVPLVAVGGDAKAFPPPAGKGGHAAFDYGNAHWSVLDLSAAGDAAAVKAWLEKDLAAAKKATWRFVALRGVKAADPWAKGLADVLQKGDVAAVFTSAAPGYQRSQPVKFAPVDGKMTADAAFDGGKKSRASGILYLILGGAPPADAKADDKLPPYTAKRSDAAGSLTVADIDGKKLTVRQLSADGKEIDSYTVTK